MLRTRHRTKLAAVLRSWLPLLSANADELDDELAKFAAENPVVRIQKARECSMPSLRRRSNAAAIEALNIAAPDRYEALELQLCARLFPTERSQEIARFIIQNLSAEGYYEEPEQLPAGLAREEIERVRARFAYLEPAGIAAKNYPEAVRFALAQSELDDAAYSVAAAIAAEPERTAEFAAAAAKDAAAAAALAAARDFLRRLAMPPWLIYAEQSAAITPDIIVDFTSEGGLRVSVADDAYSRVIIDEAADRKFYAAQLRQAAGLIDALELRRATLLKIGLQLIELQYDYFAGGAIVPMKLADIAAELGRNASTISRAIAGKYLASPRGLIALKEFFCAAVDDEGTSNAAVKALLAELIAGEDARKPLSDAALVALVNERLGVQIVRRTVTKYRLQLGIASSSERRKINELKGF